jgi:acyl-CoA thioesterase YciA
MERKRRGCPAVRVVMFPKDTNPAHNIFGGVILSNIDVAGVVEAKKICTHRFVTVNFKEVEFKKPVHVGDVLTCWVEITRIGKTSVTTHIWVDVERGGEYIPVTEGTVVYVAVDGDDKPLTIESGITGYGKRLRTKLAKAEALAKAAEAALPKPTCSAPDSAAGSTGAASSAAGSKPAADAKPVKKARGAGRRGCGGNCG